MEIHTPDNNWACLNNECNICLFIMIIRYFLLLINKFSLAQSTFVRASHNLTDNLQEYNVVLNTHTMCGICSCSAAKCVNVYGMLIKDWRFVDMGHFSGLGNFWIVNGPAK